eukprot:UN04475
MQNCLNKLVFGQFAGSIVVDKLGEDDLFLRIINILELYNDNIATNCGTTVHKDLLWALGYISLILNKEWIRPYPFEPEQLEFSAVQKMVNTKLLK